MIKMEKERGTGIVGYTTGVFDMFHIGHLRVIEQAKAECDRLIVGVMSDKLCLERKQKTPMIPQFERLEIVGAIRHVDEVVLEENADKLTAWEALRFDVIFKGDDWRGTAQWNALEEAFRDRGVKTVFFPYTNHTSSTMIRKALFDRDVNREGNG